jgi:hypothetical protein
MEQLIAKLPTMIPELLQANGMLDHENITEIPFHLLGERSEQAIRQVFGVGSGL